MGKLVIDTLGLVLEAERLGASREAAKRGVEIIRQLVVDAHDSGMSVEEIRAEFGRIAQELTTLETRAAP